MFSIGGNPANGVSAEKALLIALSQGQKVYRVTSENVSWVLPRLSISSDVKRDILNGVSAGWVAYVSESNINYSGWIGVGYELVDPETGFGAYRISGGMDGGVIKFAQTVINDPSVLRADCGGDFLSDVFDGFLRTNSALPGALAPTGVGIITGKAVARSIGGVTILEFVVEISALGVSRSMALYGAYFRSMAVFAAASAMRNFLAAGLAYEAGVAVGSVIRAATCRER